MVKKVLSLLILLCFAAFSFAQEADPLETDVSGLFEAISLDLDTDDADSQETETKEPELPLIVVPSSILNNQYYLQSVRLNNSAKAAFAEGDYDASAAYAEQAAEYARLSDEYVDMRLAEYAFARAHSRYTWAGSVGAATRYPTQYRTATTAYNEAVAARQAEYWNTTTEASNRVLIALSGVTGAGGDAGPASAALPPRPVPGQPTPETPPPVAPPPGTFPAQYTVRLWSSTGDCFSAIAGRPGVYGDPYEWRRLYEANKHKLPNPNNPHLMMPGMVIDIPSIRGETRSGMWDPNAKY